MNMNFRQMLLVLRLRWWIVLVVFILALGTTYYVATNLPKQYSAEAALLLDVRSDPLLATLMPNLVGPAFMSTQAEILRSERVASRVVKLLGLAQNASAVAQWREAMRPVTQAKVSISQAVQASSKKLWISTFSVFP